MTGGASAETGTLDAGEQARADVYRLLGALLAGPPGTELLDVLRNIQPEPAPDGEAMTAAWQALKAAAEQAEPGMLEEEYFNLFIGLGRGEVVPFASYYIHGFLMEKVLASLRGELAGLGIERRQGVAEPEDHIAALCEVMAMIISSHGLQLDQSAFFESYVASWAGRFFEDLGKAGAADFYRAVSQLGQAFLEVEQRYFSLPG
jgi:TorA maturation chaperone TorD